MPADGPVFVNNPDRVFNVVVPAILFKKALNGHFGVGILHGLLIHRCGVQHKGDTLFAQFGVLVYLLFELHATHTRQIDIAQDEEGLFGGGFQVLKSSTTIGKPDQGIADAQVLQDHL